MESAIQIVTAFATIVLAGAAVYSTRRSSSAAEESAKTASLAVEALASSVMPLVYGWYATHHGTDWYIRVRNCGNGPALNVRGSIEAPYPNGSSWDTVPGSQEISVLVPGVTSRSPESSTVLVEVPVDIGALGPADFQPDVGIDRKSTRLNSSHTDISRMPSSA